MDSIAMVRDLASRNKIPILLTLLATCIYGAYFAIRFHGLEAPDAWGYAALARNITEGKGYIASIELPYRLCFDASLPFAELRLPPLHPLVLALLFKVFGPSDAAAALCTGFFYVLSTPVLYWLAARLFDHQVALAGTLIYLFHAEMLSFAISGLTEPLFIFLLLLSFLVLVKAKSSRWFLLIGLLMGLAALTRDVGKYYLLGFLGYTLIFSGAPRYRNSGLLLLGFCLPMAPYWARNLLLLGNPFADIKYMLVLGFSDAFPGHAQERSLLGTSAWPYLLAQPGVYLQKFFEGLRQFAHAPEFRNFNIYLTAFSLVALFWPVAGEKAHRIRLLLLSLVDIQVLLAVLSVPMYRYLTPFLPLAAVYAAALMLYFYRSQWGKGWPYRGLAFSLLAVALVYPLGYSLYDGLSRHREDTSAHYSYAVQIVRSQPNTLFLSDIPGVVGWYGERTAIEIPQTVAMVADVTRLAPADAILLTSDGTENTYQTEEWKQVFREEGTIPGFTLKERYQGEGEKALLYLKATRTSERTSP